MFLPFIEAISKKFKTPVTILAKKNTKVEMYFNNKEIVEEIMYLEREDNKKHSGVKGFFKLVNELKLKKFDKVFIFNSSLRYFLISKFSGIKEVFHYPLFKKKNQQIIEAAKEFTLKSIGEDIESTPRLFLNEQDILKAKKDYSIDQSITNVILGIGGSGPTKRIPFGDLAPRWSNFLGSTIKSITSISSFLFQHPHPQHLSASLFLGMIPPFIVAFFLQRYISEMNLVDPLR